MDDAKVFTAARMDIVERVHLSVELLFVAAQRVTASGSFTMGLDAKLLKDTAMVLGSEVFVDVFKHAFISKVRISQSPHSTSLIALYDVQGLPFPIPDIHTA
jgi:hypothetical protein|tara:strand:+ start:1222 stop:1527 length:306 start_codon:yes stop_codon:yes gene_type:complete